MISKLIHKKILIGLTYYLPNISGVTQYAVILAEELVKRNYEVKVICGKHKNGLKNREIISGVEVNRVAGLAIGKGFIMPYYCWKSLQMVKMADVISCHLPSVEAFWLAIWTRVLKKKLIVTHHCEFGFDGPFSNKLIAILSFPIHWLVYHLADRIVAYTQDYAENGSIFLKRFRKKVNYILPPVKVNTRLKPMEWKTKQVIGYVGRIGWEKGLNYLLEAIPKLEKGLGDDFKIVLVGPYQEVAGDKSINRLKPLLEKYKSRVVLYGPIDHEKLGAFYKSCQCLVLPSINNLETFGIVQAEAMRCGCPVVASNLPGVRVPIKMTGMGKIAKVGDVDDLVKKIVTVIKRKRGGYYKESAIGLSQFNYLTTVEKYENILAVLE